MVVEFAIPIILTSAAISKTSIRAVFDENYPVRKPPCYVSIIIPAWREPKEFLLTATMSLRNQNIVKAFPDMFEFILVDGIDYLDEVRHLYDKVLHAPPGKLNARNVATKEAKGCIIVSVDADTYYPPNWLNLMLEPYHHDPNVVATTSTKYFEFIDYATALLKPFFHGNRVSGRASTFKKWAFKALGGFRIAGIDQRNAEQMVLEEEIMFKRRLEQLGKVVFVNAPVIHLGEEAPWKMMAGRGIRVEG